jgi:serine/threonine protein phosphatase PrpC
MTTTATNSFDIGSHSEVGHRPNNEDRVLAVEDWGAVSAAQRRDLGRLYLLSDGVGGNADGQDAAEQVVERLMAYYYLGSYVPDLAPALRLEAAIQDTTRDIHADALRRSNDMRATLVAALVLDPHGDQQTRSVVVSNVGDSPAILVRRGESPRTLSRAHVRRDGSLDQAMGDESVFPHLLHLELGLGDALVLCSDGLSDGARGPITPNAIRGVVESLPAQQATHELVRLAGLAGSTDNISVLVIRNGAPPAPPMRRRRATRRRSAPALPLVLALIAVGVLGWALLTLIRPSPQPIHASSALAATAAPLAATPATTATLAATPAPSATPPRSTSVPATQPTVAVATRVPATHSPKPTRSPTASAATTVVATGATTVVATSLPPGAIVMPNVLGMGARQAEAALIALGVPADLIVLDEQFRNEIPDFDQIAPYLVVSTNPPPGSLILPGRRIAIGWRSANDTDPATQPTTATAMP